jgi:hypothetical protein
LLKVALNTIAIAPKMQQILFIQLRHQVQHEQPNIHTEIQTHIHIQYKHYKLICK